MSRTSVVLLGIALVAVVAHGCTGVVPLAPGYYPAMLDTGEVRVIDARTLDRAQTEAVLEQHNVIGRFDVRVPQRGFEEKLAIEVEKGKQRALSAGGNVLMYTDDSELIAVIKHDARYAGAPDAITMYVMLPRG
jgi:hypothetical protein